MAGKKKKNTVKSDNIKKEETFTINFVWSEEVKVAINRIKTQLLCPCSWTCAIPGVINEDYDILIPDADIIYRNILRERHWLKKIEELKYYDPCGYKNVIRNFQSSVFNPRQICIQEEINNADKEKKSKSDSKSDSDNVNAKKKNKILNNQKNEKNETKIEDDELRRRPNKLFTKPCCPDFVEARTKLFPNLCLTESSLSLISLHTQVVVQKPIESEKKQVKEKEKKESNGKRKSKKKNK